MDLEGQILNKRTIVSFVISLGIILYILSKIDLDKLVLILKKQTFFIIFCSSNVLYLNPN
ncbi:hypothetical protein [Methanocaldococcus jannaschii]|uniref:hypothetical protein n=1 Tax=Methanocaldococcus jannaschii TaxID=2190 RepID=UPI0007DC217C|nr:hypothetical protein [Methanocaldococcus jannaschii]